MDATRVELALPGALQPGDRYRVTLEPGTRWNDWGRNPVDPLEGDDGACSFWMTLFKPLRCMPREPCMVPGMAVADYTRFNRVCLRSERRLGADGLLLAVDGPAVSVAFFADDVPGLNGNNGSAVWVRVQRPPVAAPDAVNSRT